MKMTDDCQSLITAGDACTILLQFQEALIGIPFLLFRCQPSHFAVILLIRSLLLRQFLRVQIIQIVIRPLVIDLLANPSRQDCPDDLSDNQCHR